MPRRGRFNVDGGRGATRGESASLIGPEEEQLILDNRSAQREAELIPAKRRFFYTLLVQKKVVGVGGIVAEIFPHAAMGLVGPRFGHQVDGAACAVAVLPRHVQPQLLEFLD